MFALPPFADFAADIKVGEWDRQRDFVHRSSRALSNFIFKFTESGRGR